MTADVWIELAIAPTTEEAAIRRAYAARLKLCRPEEDAAAFLRLRGAYEAALRQARPRVAAPSASPLPPPGDVACDPPPAPLPKMAPDMRISGAIAQGEVQRGADLLQAGQGEMPIGAWMRLTDLLAGRLAADKSVPDAEVMSIAHQFQWDGPGYQGASRAVAALRVRLAALQWISRLRVLARHPTRLLGNERAAAAALLLGRGPIALSWLLPPYGQIGEVLSQLHAHGAWAETRIDATRLARLRAFHADQHGQRVRRYAAAVLVAAAFCATQQFPLAVAAPVLLCRIGLSRLRITVVAALLAAIPPAILDDAHAYYDASILVIAFGIVFVLAAAVYRIARSGRKQVVRILKSMWLPVLLWIASLAVAGFLANRVAYITGSANAGSLCFIAFMVAPAFLRGSRRSWRE